MLLENYFLPKTIEEALQLLLKFNGKVRIVAGGTDLMIDLMTHKKTIMGLVDISQIGGLGEVRKGEGKISIGAMVTHSQASKSAIITRRAPCLAEACSWVGSPQVRNMGTLVGNIVNAMPAADAASALIALGARLKVVSWPNMERIVPIEETYKTLGISFIDSTREIVTGVEFPVPEGANSSSFQRLSRRKALALPVLNAAVFIHLDEKLRIFKEARIVVGPVAPIPFRAQSAETSLTGSLVTEGAIKQASEAASREASPRTSLRAGREYRKEMVKVLVERGLRQAIVHIHPEFSSLSNKP